jgi:hypothetical protein
MSNYYTVTVSDIGESICRKAKLFAERVVSETYDRFSYDYNRRVETIYIGKLAEEVFIKFAKNSLDLELVSNYDIYNGTTNVDKFDFTINGVDIDIKSSKDTKNEGIENCYRYFNFPVPTDQDIKDVTVSILYDYQVENFYIVSWIDKETYKKHCKIKNLPVGGGKWKEYYLYQLKLGNPISTLKDYLRTKCNH